MLFSEYDASQGKVIWGWYVWLTTERARTGLNYLHTLHLGMMRYLGNFPAGVNLHP